MDGNGRWAQKRGLPRSMGHRKGAEVVKAITKTVAEMGIKYLTLYAFSTENWQRSPDEVDYLMGLLRQYLQNDLQEIKDNKIRIRFIGERYMLDNDIQQQMSKLEDDTKEFDKMTLCIALSYGSRHEILNAVKKTSLLVKNGDISVEDIDINLFSDMLYTKDIPDPDLIIRTSGEQRLSNFLLWQVAYSELIFTNTYWPDFTGNELKKCLYEYQKRERKFGDAK